MKKEYRYIPSAGVDDEKPDEWGVTDAQAAFSWDVNVQPQVLGHLLTYLHSHSSSFDFQATKIHWKDDAHNLTKIHPRVFDDGDELSEPGSFFNLFEVAKDHMEVS